MGKYKVKDWIEGPYDGKDKAAWEEEIVIDYGQSLALGEKTISDVILEMRPYVVETADLVVAAKAWSLLPLVFESRPLKLSRHDMTRLIEYTCQRIENKGDLYVYDSGIEEMASLLKAIVKNKHYIPGDASVMIKAILHFGKSPRYAERLESTRRVMLEVVESLIKTDSVPLLRDTGAQEIIDGIVNMAAFEKRPTNLAIIFQLYSHIASSWTINDSQCTAIWDSFMRYFPVSMKGAANVPGVPTGRELADLMMQCMYSNPKFADRTFERMIDMLDDSSDLSANVKKEVFRNLDGCITGYPSTTIAEWSSRLWDSLKFEIWNGENEEFIQKSLDVLRSIASNLEFLGNSFGDEKTPLYTYVLGVTNDCRNRIVDSRTKYLSTTGRILYVLGAFSPYIFSLVQRTILPSMFLLSQDATAEKEKTGILTVFNQILKARLESTYRNQEYTDEMEKAFLLQREKFFEVFSTAIFEVKIFEQSKEINEESCSAIPAIEGMCLLFDISGLLSSSQKGLFVQQLMKIILASDGTAGIRVQVVKALKHISSREPRLFEDMILTKLMERLPKEIPIAAYGHQERLNNVVAILQDLVDVSCEPCMPVSDGDTASGHPVSHWWHRNFNLVQTAFLNKLDAILKARGQVDYAVAILAAMYQSLASFDQALTDQNHQAAPLDPENGPYSEFIARLIQMTVQRKPYPPGHPLQAEGRTYMGVVTLANHSALEMRRPINKIELQRILGQLPDVRDGIETNYTHPGDAITDEFLSWVGKYFMCVLQSKTTTEANNFVFKMIRHGRSWDDDSHMLSLVDGPPDKCQALILMTYMYAGVKPVDGDNKTLTKTKAKLGIEGIVGKMAVTMASNITNPKTPGGKKWRLMYGQYLQVLVAKFHAGRDKLPGGDYLSGHLLAQLAKNSPDSGQDPELTYLAITYAASAALAVMDGPTMTPLLDRLSEAIQSGSIDAKLRRIVAISFRLLLKKSTFFDEESCVKLSPLRYSRLYNTTGLRLMNFWKDHGDQIKNGIDKRAERNNVLAALAGILHYQNPMEIMSSKSIKELMPILLAGTDIQDDDWARVTYLKLIKNLIPLDPGQFAPYVDDILSHLTGRIRNTLNEHSDISIQARVLALEIISVLMKLVDNALHKSRRVPLVRLLDFAKNDVSYRVRQKAHYCRLEWMYES